MSGETGPTGPEAERMVASIRPHARALFWPSLALIVLSGVTAFFTGSFDAAWQNWTVFGVGAGLVVLLWLLPVLSWLSRRYVITTRRIILRRGLFVRHRKELLHSRGYDVAVRKHALQTMFRSGDITITTGPERPVVLGDVPDAVLVSTVLHDLMESNQNLVSARRQQAAARTGEHGPGGQGPGGYGTGGYGTGGYGTGGHGGGYGASSHGTPSHGTGEARPGYGTGNQNRADQNRAGQHRPDQAGGSGDYGTGPTTAYGQGPGQGNGPDDTGPTTVLGSR